MVHPHNPLIDIAVNLAAPPPPVVGGSSFLQVVAAMNALGTYPYFTSEYLRWVQNKAQKLVDSKEEMIAKEITDRTGNGASDAQNLQSQNDQSLTQLKIDLKRLVADLESFSDTIQKYKKVSFYRFRWIAWIVSTIAIGLLYVDFSHWSVIVLIGVWPLYHLNLHIFCSRKLSHLKSTVDIRGKDVVNSLPDDQIKQSEDALKAMLKDSREILATLGDN
jgi:hypothetical protein